MTQMSGTPAPVPPAHLPITRETVLSSLSAFSAAWLVVMGIRYFALQSGDVNGALDVGADTGSWLSTAYSVAEPLGVVIGTWLGIIFSVRRLLLSGVMLFLIGSIIPLAVPGYDALLISRAVTGLAGGAIMPQSIIIQLRTWGPTRTPLALSLYLSAPTAAPQLGGIIGAWGVEHFGWSAILWSAIPMGLLSLGTGMMGLKREPISWRPLIHADVSGILSLSGAIAFFAFAMSQGDRMRWFQSTAILFSFLASGVCLAYFLARDLRAVRYPILWLRLFRRRNIQLTAIGVFPFALALSVSGVVIPFALAQLQGFRPEQISAALWSALWPQPFSYALCIWVMAKKIFDYRTMIVMGLGILAIGAFYDIVITSDWQYGELFTGQVIQGIGLPLLAVPLIDYFVGDLRPPAESLPGAAVFNLARVLFSEIATTWATTTLRLGSQARFGQLLENTAFYPGGRGVYLVALAGRIAHMESDSVRATLGSIAIFAHAARQQASVLAISDMMETLGCVLFLSCLLPIAMAEFNRGKRFPQPEGHS